MGNFPCLHLETKITDDFEGWSLEGNKYISGSNEREWILNSEIISKIATIIDKLNGIMGKEQV